MKSCSNDDAEMPDYSTFFNEKAPSLYGKFNSQTIYWEFSLDYQMFYGFENRNVFCSETDLASILCFWFNLYLLKRIDNYHTYTNTIFLPSIP